MSDPSTDRLVQQTKLPPQTVERWRQIVQRAVRNGTDISQLVQHFAERAFENKTVSLDSQGARRRALTHMRQTLTREVGRAQKLRAAHQDGKKLNLARPYEGITLTFVPPQRLGKQNKKTTVGHVVPLALDGDTQASKSSPLAQKLHTVQELDAYIATLVSQGLGIDAEMAQIDTVLNRGMHNRDSTVAELSATTVELWRIAQEEVEAARLAAPSAPLSPGVEPTETPALPTPMSDEKTSAWPAAPAKSTSPAGRHPALAAGQALLQALFKKKS